MVNRQSLRYVLAVFAGTGYTVNGSGHKRPVASLVSLTGIADKSGVDQAVAIVDEQDAGYLWSVYEIDSGVSCKVMRSNCREANLANGVPVLDLMSVAAFLDVLADVAPEIIGTALQNGDVQPTNS